MCFKRYIFCTFLLNPHFDLEPDYINRKPIKHRFQLNIVRTEILSTFHTRVGKLYVIPPIQTNGGRKFRKIPPNSPSPCGTWTHPTHHPKRQQLDRCTHFITTTQQSLHWLQWDAPNSPPKLPLLLRRSPPKSNTVHPFLDRPLSPPQTVSGSNQPFRHNTLCGQNDRQLSNFQMNSALRHVFRMSLLENLKSYSASK